MLPSVNYEVNNYGAAARKNVPLSKCFTLTDEAFALACVENYCQRWRRKNMARESARNELLGVPPTPVEGEELPPHKMPKEWFRAKWSGSHNGNRLSGWSQEGITHYVNICEDLKRKRHQNSTGAVLEEYIKGHWKGTLKEKKKPQKKRLFVEAFHEDHEFDTKYAEI